MANKSPTKSESIDSIKRKASVWLTQGISPRRLAFTLALGFAIGCIPVVGIPTALCALLALALRLNLPAIQAANYLGRLMPSGSNHAAKAGALMNSSPLKLLSLMGSLTGHAMLAWFVIAVPAVLLMTLMLTVLLRRIPALAAAEAGD
jgi:uncharacterized protein (DUF2062 family)